LFKFSINFNYFLDSWKRRYSKKSMDCWRYNS